MESAYQLAPQNRMLLKPHCIGTVQPRRRDPHRAAQRGSRGLEARCRPEGLRHLARWHDLTQNRGVRIESCEKPLDTLLKLSAIFGAYAHRASIEVRGGTKPLIQTASAQPFRDGSCSQVRGRGQQRWRSTARAELREAMHRRGNVHLETRPSAVAYLASRRQSGEQDNG